MDDFENQLNRKSWAPNQAQRHGVDFEDAVTRFERRRVVGARQKPGLSELFKEFCKHVENGRFQQVAKTVIDVDGQDYVLYGRIDVLFNDHIIDIKTTGNYRGPESYRKTWQHRMYCYATGITSFTYLVALLEYDKSSSYRANLGRAKFVDMKTIDIDLAGRTDEILDEIKGQIRSIMSYLEDEPDLMIAYETKFNRS